MVGALHRPCEMGRGVDKLLNVKVQAVRSAALMSELAAPHLFRRPQLWQCPVLQAVCFLRPTRENIARVRRELREPRYGEYHLCECWRHPCSWLLLLSKVLQTVTALVHPESAPQPSRWLPDGWCS